MRATSAIILAAGQGTRMKSKYPKVMAEVLFKPMINWVTDWCLKAGIEKICVVVGSGADQVRAALPQQCVTVEQTERLGTGHAVMMAKEFIREHPGDVVVLNGDAPFVSDQVIGSALERHRQSGAQVTVVTARLHDPSGYGRILRENGRVTGIVEDRDATGEQKQIAEVNSGAYCFESGFLLEALEQLTCRNSQGEYYLTDTVQVAFRQGKKVEACLCEDEKLVLGANDRAGLLKLNEIANKIVVDRLLEDGVNFYCTDGVVISPDAVVGRDTTIAPGTQLRGHVVIGEDCVVGPDSRLTDTVLGDRVKFQYSTAISSSVDDDTTVGPYAYIRPDCHIGKNVKIGDFVEVKNSNVGDGTKVSHLTYIGDSDVGERINFGCGTVTVNYDGHKKYRTVIGDDVFIGCNTNLVAPVNVGRGSYIAAGSTITDDIPEDCLAIARERQINKSGWTKK